MPDPDIKTFATADSWATNIVEKLVENHCLRGQFPNAGKELRESVQGSAHSIICQSLIRFDNERRGGDDG